MLSSRTRRSGSRASALLRLAAVTVGRTDTALGAFYRRLSARIGKAKAITATARKIAVLFYSAVRHGMEYVDPGSSYYETRYRTRVVENLHRRAKAFGFSAARGSRKLVPFLRNRSPASVRRSWHAATSHRPLAWLVSRLPVRKSRKRLPQAAFPCRYLVGVDVEMLRQLGDGSVALDGGQCHLRLEGR